MEDYYRWHDIRKDPEDLPLDSQIVLICYLPKEFNETNCEAWAVGSMYEDENIFTDMEERIIDNVIAWKYVELFLD